VQRHVFGVVGSDIAVLLPIYC